MNKLQFIFYEISLLDIVKVISCPINQKVVNVKQVLKKILSIQSLMKYYVYGFFFFLYRIIELNCSCLVSFESTGIRFTHFMDFSLESSIIIT